MPFPDAALVFVTNGGRGIVIADVHDEPQHVHALTRNLGVLYASGVRVLFLEHFRHTQENLHIHWFDMMSDPVPAMIEENHFNWYPAIATNMRQLLMSAYAADLKVHGLNVPAPQGMHHILWRMGGSNKAMADVVKNRMKKCPQGTGFAIFIGADHARGLRKYGCLPNIKCYKWNGASYDEIPA